MTLGTRTFGIVVSGCLAVLVVGGFLAFGWPALRTEADFQVQARLATAEGLPATASAFEAYLPRVADAANAAPSYVALSRLPRLSGDPTKIGQDVLFGDRTAAVKRASSYLTAAVHQLETAEAAVAKPHCRFDRDWSLGVAVLFPEFGPAKSAAKSLLLRGTLSATAGRPLDALQEVKRVQKMAAHFRQEPTRLSQAVAGSLDSSALRQLAMWAYAFRNEPRYREALRGALQSLPEPDLHDWHRFDLVEIMTTIELCKTKKGRDKIGLKDSDLPPSSVANALALAQPPDKGRLEVIKAMRDMWTAIDAAEQDRKLMMDKAENRMYRGLVSFPIAARLYEALSDTELGTTSDPSEERKAKVILYTAFVRAIETPSGSPVKVEDLRSPYDGKPVSVKRSGDSIEVELSTPHGLFGGMKLVVPPKGSNGPIATRVAPGNDLRLQSGAIC
ncbi:MAG: hypothetical protein JST30_00570 [Armatimonadetes bacterium]|nr:hypothetical protein [Armatimonadota bacterium]